MSNEPYVLPGLPGHKTLADNLGRDALFTHVDGETYAFRGLLPDGRWVMYSLGDEPRPLQVADAVTGFPAHPTHAQVIEAMAKGELALISSPLDEPARNRARGEEKTKKEVIEDDPYAQVRMDVCRLADKERPPLDPKGLEKWSERRFDWEAIKKEYGREKPPGSTMRTWIKKRGRRGNRCWADMEDRRGQGPRAKRVTGYRLAIAVWHAISHWTSRRHPTVNKLWKDVEADTDGYNRGEALIMHDGKRVWPKPADEDQIKVADKEFFRQLVKRLEGRHSYKTRFSAQAAQQRFEGGGSAPEPVRYLEIVQQDECEVPAFFFIDSINRLPLGTATWVIAVDVYTRCILAWDLSFDTPSVRSWMRNLLNASKFKSLPKEYAEHFPELATIGGRMSAVMYDNPQHLIGHAVEDAHGDIAQDVIFAGEHEPTHKGLVERTHETLRTLFVAELPGAKMQIALAREFDMDPSKETLITLGEARLAMARAICKYHTTELKGLGMRTPLDVWVEQWNRWGPQHAKDQEQFSRAIGNVTFPRVLDNGGIVVEHIEYSEVDKTPRLMEDYASFSADRRKTKKPAFDTKVKWDPTDLSAISVFNPKKNKYEKLKGKKKRYTAGLTLGVHKLVMRHKAAQSLLMDPDGERRLLEIRRLAETELKRISPKMQLAEQRARAALMQQPSVRELYGSAIELIDVAPSPTGREVVHDDGIGRLDGLRLGPRGKRGGANNKLHPEQVDDIDLSAVATSADADEEAGEPDGVAGKAAGSVKPPRGDLTARDDDDDDIVGGFESY